MGILENYLIDLKGLREPQCSRSYVLDDAFFAAVDAAEVQRGSLTAAVDVKQTAGVFLFTFRIKGVIYVPCDRCLDDMPLAVDITETLRVRLADCDGEEGDVVLISAQSGTLNIAWYIYEFVALSIPIKHTHAEGACNQQMAEKLREHMASGDNSVEENLPDEAITE